MRIFFRTLIFLSALTIVNQNIYSANRYWIAGTSSNWNNTANWSTTSGGAGGASVPGVGDDVFFNNNGLGNCLIDISPTINSINIASSFTGIIDVNGNVFNVNGTNNNVFAGGTINDSPSTGSFSVTSSAITTFSGTTYNVDLNINSSRLRFNGSTFNNPVNATKNGSGNDAGSGGNTFNAPLIVTNAGSGYLLFGNTNPDTFNNDVTVFNTGTNIIYFAHNSVGNQFNGNIILNATSGNGIRFGQAGGSTTLAATKTISIGGSGFSSGTLRIRGFTQTGTTAQSLTLTGSASIYLEQNSTWNGNVNILAPRVYIRQTTFNGTTSITKTGNGNDNNYGGNIFNNSTTIVNNGTGHIYYANNAADTFNNDVTLIVSNTGRLYLSNTANGTLFNGNIFINYITNTNIYIGNNSGTSSLTSGKTISVIGAGASGCGNLYLEEFTQIGGTAQAISLNGSGILSIGPNTTFNGDFLATAPGFYLRESVFNGIVNIDKTGSSGNTSYGGNTYNGVTSITNSGSNYLRLAGTLGNTYNAQVTFSSTGSDLIEPSRSGNSVFNDDLYFNSTGTSTGIRFGNGGGVATLAATKTVNVGGSGFSSGDLQFRNFVQTGNTAQSLTLTGSARLYNYDSNWGGDVTFIAPRINTRGTNYSRTAYLEKTGATNDASAGGNTFNMDATFVNSGSGYFMFGNGTFDTYATNVTLTNTGTNHIYFAYNGAGHAVGGNLTTTNSATGASNGIYIGTGSTSTLNVTGNVSLTQNGSATSLYTYLGDQGDITVNGTVTMLNSGTGNTSDMRIANNTNSSVIINGNTTITNSNSASTTNRIYVGNQGDITFNGTLDLINNSGVANSAIYCNYNANSNNLYNQNITVQSTNANCDGIRFGQNGGTGTLAATKTITIGTGGFIAGELWFRNFIQNGTTPQSLTLTGSALLRFRDGSVFNGDLTTVSPRLYTEGGTFNGTTMLTKNGNYNDNPRGGCTFNGVTTITNTSSNRLRMSNSSAYVDDFNNDVTFVRSGTGNLDIAYRGTNTFANNININGTSTITFGRGGGTALIDGTSAQSINDALGTSATPDFYLLEVNKPNNHLTLNMPINVRTTLTLTSGNINTTTTNLLTMFDNSTVGSVSNISYVRGPIEKIGNDAFTFPVGDSSYYRPISISAPSNNTHSFRAEYIEVDPHPTYDENLKDVTIDHISSCEYWILDRTSGNSNVSVTLSWDANSCGVTSLPDLKVARWNGTQWKDHGNGGTTGNTSTGTVVSSTTISNFSPFTLASRNALNPLPIELISFNAELINNRVDLTWQTASEINNDYFTLEKSKDGINWVEFAEQKGAGNSNTILNYTEIDYQPYTGISYYRLKQTDFDGAYEYSKIVAINNNHNEISVYPNPVKDILTIEGLNDDDFINIIAIDGRDIYNGHSSKVNTSQWSTGIYNLIIKGKDGVIKNTIKVVK